MAAGIKIRIDKQGNVHFDVHGVQGPSCEKLTEALIRATGDEVDKEWNSDYVLELPDYLEQFEE